MVFDVSRVSESLRPVAAFIKNLRGYERAENFTLISASVAVTRLQPFSRTLKIESLAGKTAFGDSIKTVQFEKWALAQIPV